MPGVKSACASLKEVSIITIRLEKQIAGDTKMAKNIAETPAVRAGTSKDWRSVKSPAKPGSVSSAAVRRAVKKVANRRTRVSSGSNPQRQTS